MSNSLFVTTERKTYILANVRERERERERERVKERERMGEHTHVFT